MGKMTNRCSDLYLEQDSIMEQGEKKVAEEEMEENKEDKFLPKPSNWYKRYSKIAPLEALFILNCA